ncbi:MAG: hypothetical protein AAF627_16735 [Myxococcota bacterium]
MNHGVALDAALARLGPIDLGTERIPIGSALGRVPAEKLEAEAPIPPSPEAAHEGLALDPRATPGQLALVGQLDVGETFDGRLPLGSALLVGLEAPLPPGAKAVVPLSDVKWTEDQVLVAEAVQEGTGILHPGTDGGPDGECLMETGRPLSAARLHLLEKAGVEEVCVYRRPKVAVGGGGHPSLPALVARWMEACRPWLGPLRHELQAEARFDVDLLVEVGDHSPGFRASIEHFPTRPGGFQWGRDPRGRPWLRLPPDPFGAWCAWSLVAPAILPGFEIRRRWAALSEPLAREETHRFLPARLVPRGLGPPLLEVIPREGRLWSWLAACDGALPIAPRGPKLETETMVELSCF